MQQGRLGMQGGRGGQGNFRRTGGKSHGRGGFRGHGFQGGRGGFQGGPGGFRGGPGGGMGAAFHIGPPGMWWKNPSLVQKLTLTPEQTKKMDDIFQSSRIQLIDLHANVEKQNALLEPLLSANPPDTAKALAQIDKVAQARAELEKGNAKMLLGIRGVLTPDQWTKLHAQPGRPQGAPGGPGQPGGTGEAGGYGGGGYGGYGGGYGGGRGGPHGSSGGAPGVEMDDTRH
jgi:Spy/CpxP family protein refolding chaperone